MSAASYQAAAASADFGSQTASSETPRKARLILVAAPSGAGKSSFVDRVVREVPHLRDTVTYTTRAMRVGEREGFPYHFVGVDEFERLKNEGYFAEWARVHNQFYGTPKNQLEKAWAENDVVVMDIDIQGVASLKKLYPDAVSIFILPPSIDELRRRVILRNAGVVPQDLDIRMKNAQLEIQSASKFDYQIINDQFEPSFAEFKNIIQSLI